jgi:hypothetical protein
MPFGLENLQTKNWVRLLSLLFQFDTYQFSSRAGIFSTHHGIGKLSCHTPHYTNKMEARLPIDKLERARQAAAKAATTGSISLVDIQSLAGFLSFYSPVVRLGWVFMRRIWSFMASYPTSKFVKRRIPSGVLNDLRWWKQLLPDFNGVLFLKRIPETQLASTLMRLILDSGDSDGERKLYLGSLQPKLIRSSHYVNI